MTGEELAVFRSLPQQIARSVRDALRDSASPIGGLGSMAASSGRDTNAGNVISIIKSILTAIKELAAGKYEGKGVGGAAGDWSMGMVLPRVRGIIEPAAGIVKDFVQAVRGALGPFAEMTQTAAHFVEEFDPSTVTMLSQHFRDLNAVIGIALKPIVDVSREVVRYLSSVLLPLMREFQPIVKELSQEVAGVLMDAIKDMADFLHDTMPMIKAIKDILVGLIAILKDVFMAFRTLFAASMELGKELLGAFGGEGASVKDFMNSLRQGIQTVVAALIGFAARLMALIGWTKGIEAMQKAIAPRDTKREIADGMAVAQNPMFKSISELSRSIQVSMFAASKAGEERVDPQIQSAEFLKTISKDIAIGAQEGRRDRDKLMLVLGGIQTLLGRIEKLIPPRPPVIDQAANGFGRVRDLHDKFQQFVLGAFR